MSEQMPQQSPVRRVTVRDGRLTVASTEGMPRRGWAGAVARDLADRGVHLADIHVIAAGEERHELVVRFLAEGRAVERAKNVIADWALATGHARVWFRDELRDLTDAIPPSGDVYVFCGTCTARWVENDVEFWETVRAYGGFPTTCPACGGTLPQWTVVGPSADASLTSGKRVGSTPPVSA